jgi:nicotinamidase/pyrazinamidase
MLSNSGLTLNESSALGRWPGAESDLMLAGPLVFVDVDTQRDFLEPAGALYVAGSVEIIPNLARLSQFARSHHVPVLATACAHQVDDPELTRFPPHCLTGTPGQERIPATAARDSVVLEVEDRLCGPLPPHLTLHKRQIDVFTRPDADELVGRYNDSLAQPLFVVYGVCSDYCVREVVDGLLKRGCRVAIVVDAIRAIDPAAEAGVLTDFARRGAVLTVTEVVCG